MSQYDYTFKIMVLGNNSTKPDFLQHFRGYFMQDLKLTLGIDFYSQTTIFDNKKVKLQIWDYDAEERFRFLLSQYCKGSNGAIFIYDMTNPSTLENISEWVRPIRSNAGDIPILLIGLKIHSDESQVISRQEGISVAENYNLSAFIEICTETGQNVEQVFEVLTELLFEEYEQTNLNMSGGLICLEPLKSVPIKIKQEIVINDYLELRLENDKTNIYVGGKLFHRCKYLLLNILSPDFKSFKEIESVDEAAEKLDRSMERIRSCRISPQTEFWGHCSNLQAWHENNYDTRILHRNLAFPLLKALVDEGDKRAKKVFKEQLALRLESGYPSVVLYLIDQGYLKYLTNEELDTILKNPDFLRNLPKWVNNFKNIPNWFSLKIKTILNNLKCPYCNIKIKRNPIKRILNGESIRCELCYSNIF